MKNIDADIIKDIYSQIGDEYSRQMFENRFMYSITNDTKYIKKVINMTDEGIKFFDRLNAKRPTVIFGAGIWGQEIVKTFQDIQFECFVDNKVRTDELCMNLPVITFQQYLDKYKDAMIIIATRLYYKSIYQQLTDVGIKDENIINAGKMIDDMSKRQYFDLPEMKLNMDPEGESFVDGGSFDGRTAVLFMDWCDNNYNKVWAFEPDIENRKKCIKTLTDNKCRNFEVISKGLWEEQTELFFKAISNGASKVVGNGEYKIDTIRLDDVIDKNVTFIKLDIEGSEYKALLGSEKMIKRYKPKLAISIYHNPEDIWEIPELILKINNEYKFYFRHYSIAAAETVLYAI